MNRIIVTTIIFLALIQSFLYADVVIYLKSTITAKNNLTLSDIAQVDGDEALLVKNLKIPDSALKDGYITKNEVHQSIKNVVSGLLIIHGYAVKVVTESSSISDRSLQELSPVNNVFTVTKGDLVTVKVIKKSIVIEITGKALQSGKTGDEIKISLQSGKTVTAKIVNNGVECYL